MKTEIEIIKSYYNHTMTDADLQDYIDNYMTEAEKAIGKPHFCMTDEEQVQCDIMEYNLSYGELENYNCDKCRNKGYIRYLNDMGYVMNRPCECNTIRDTINRMKESGLGELLEVYTFDNYKTTKSWQKTVLERAKQFVLSNSSGFTIIGSTGAGKSMICTAIARELLLKGMSLKYMVWVEEANYLKSHKMDSEIYQPLMERYKNVDVLYIDDFLKTDNNARPTTADINLAMEIINYRYYKSKTSKQRLITIISSERTLDQLIEYDEAIAGRIKEMSGEYFLVISGKDKNYRFYGEN